jgi:hypothetical protein
MKKSNSITTTLLSLLLVPLLLLLALPTAASASTGVTTGGGTFNNSITSFSVVASNGGYTFYSRTATGAATGTITGTQNVQAFGVLLPSGAIVEQGTITGTFTVAGLTGTIDWQFNLYAANGVSFVGQEIGVGSGGLAGLYATATFQGVINPTGPATGTYQSEYQFGGYATPPVEAPLSQNIGSLTAADTQVGAPVVVGGYTFITYTADTTESGTTVGSCTGVANQVLVVYPDGSTFAFAGSCTFVGTVGGSSPGSDLAPYLGQGVLSTGAYTAIYGVSDGSGGLAGIQGTAAFSGTHGVAAAYSGWQLLPDSLGPGVNLQKADLQGLILQGANLGGDNLQHASLANDNLGGLNFAGANLQWADLSGATLAGTTTQSTNFNGANMQHANLENAICGSPNFITAAGTHTQQIDLTGSSGCNPPL